MGCLLTGISYLKLLSPVLRNHAPNDLKAVFLELDWPYRKAYANITCEARLVLSLPKV